MNDFKAFLTHQAEWLKGTGPESDIVISSRIRMARNIEGFPFHGRLSEKDKKLIIREMKEAVSKSNFLKSAYFLKDDELTEIDQQFFVERHLISHEHTSEEGEKAVVITADEIVSIMILEEDHLRTQVLQSGFNLIEAWRIAEEIDVDLEKNVKFSFDPNIGYLTACPTNVGTGLRASCMLHLPSLVLTKQIHKVLQALSKLNLAVRGLYGEGTQALGNFFQFSNQITLGQPEAEIIENLEGVIRQVITHERNAREYLMTKRKVKMSDQIWRAVGTLKSARIISSSEAIQLLSLVQLGVDMKLLGKEVQHKDLNQLFLLIQPAHLQKIAGKVLETTERDIRRADLVRKRFSKISF